MSLLSVALDPILTLLYPPRCLACRTLGTPNGLCVTCLNAISPVPEPICLRCGQSLVDKPKCPHCAQRTPAFVRARAMGAYEGTLRESIHRFKYRDRPQLAEPLGVALAAFALDHSSTFHNLQFDAIIPIPMHPVRKRLRGYNQSERLATVLASELTLSHQPNLLTRTRNTKPQVGLTGDARAGNLKDAFSAPHPEQVSGKIFLLIDDVSTTSSTLHEAAKALKEAGAKGIYGLTLAAG